MSLYILEKCKTLLSCKRTTIKRWRCWDRRKWWKKVLKLELGIHFQLLNFLHLFLFIHSFIHSESTQRMSLLSWKLGRNTHPERKGMGVLSNEEERAVSSSVLDDEVVCCCTVFLVSWQFDYIA